jgi:hypothetical protein
MVYFQTKNLDLDKFWRVLQWKMPVYYTAIWFILLLFGVTCVHLSYFMVILYIFFTFWYVALRKIWQPCIGVDFGHKVHNCRPSEANDKRRTLCHSGFVFGGMPTRCTTHIIGNWLFAVASVVGRVTRCVGEKLAQNVAQSVHVKIRTWLLPCKK